MASLEVPTGADASPTKGKTKRTRRPTWEMEQVSKYWDLTQDPRERTQNKTVDAISRRCAGKGKTPTQRD